MKELHHELLAFERSLPREKRKRLGQFFTSEPVARLLATLAVQGGESRVIDPMAGHGSLLEAAAERCHLSSAHVTLAGIEVDEATAKLCRARARWCIEKFHHVREEVVTGDAFTEDSWKTWSSAPHFDLVISNPPYVRYQSSSDQKDEVRDALQRLVPNLTPTDEQPIWSQLIRSYSGLSDLSVPSWLLCAMACRPGGTLALVVPKTWLNRAYARILRYVQLRFFEPLFLIEENGVGWFRDALVPTTLVVSRRLSAAQAVVPLFKRDYGDQRIVRVTLGGEAASSEASLLDRAFPGDNPEAAFLEWLKKERNDVDGVDVHREPLSFERERILSDARKEPWLAELEGLSSRKSSNSRVPRVLCRALNLRDNEGLLTLEEAGVKIGQGLRTGCNQFFYVDLEVAKKGTVSVSTSELFRNRSVRLPEDVLRPVLRRQSEIGGFALDPSTLVGRVLYLENWVLPEHSDGVASKHGRRVMPEPLAGFIRDAAVATVKRGEKSVAIPALSAVSPNERTSKNGRILTRFWYMLPEFAPRHLPLAFVPRVNANTPYFVLNSSKPVVIDANFSTIYDLGTIPTRHGLIALLNSTWCRVCSEAIGTPMGGGALKLEAAHVREIPIPLLTSSLSTKLDALGKRLVGSQAETTAKVMREIDGDVLGAVLGKSPKSSAVKTAIDRLAELLDSLRQQRKRTGRLHG